MPGVTNQQIRDWMNAYAVDPATGTLDICAIQYQGESACFFTDIYSIPFSFPPGRVANRLLLAAGVSFKLAAPSNARDDKPAANDAPSAAA